MFVKLLLKDNAKVIALGGYSQKKVYFFANLCETMPALYAYNTPLVEGNTSNAFKSRFTAILMALAHPLNIASIL